MVRHQAEKSLSHGGGLRGPGSPAATALSTRTGGTHGDRNLWFLGGCFIHLIHRRTLDKPACALRKVTAPSPPALPTRPGVLQGCQLLLPPEAALQKEYSNSLATSELLPLLHINCQKYLNATPWACQEQQETCPGRPFVPPHAPAVHTQSCPGALPVAHQF